MLLPLLPAFEGKIGSSTGSALRTILHYQYASISRGEMSLCQRLKKAGVTDPMVKRKRSVVSLTVTKITISIQEYISFCSLRTRSELLNTPVTELVYIHSKLMIVDDRLVICGSANINDRSMLGNRDSEVREDPVHPCISLLEPRAILWLTTLKLVHG